MQYHHKKNECGYIIKGKLKIKFDLGDGILRSKILKKGDILFSSRFSHQEIALTDCEIIEASTPHFNDKLEWKKYGKRGKAFNNKKKTLSIYNKF